MVLATASLIGEGFDMPELDALVLATPLSFEGRMVQYAGRLHRLAEGKEDVMIYDYLDTYCAVFIKMYRERVVAYRKMGYKSEEPDHFFGGKSITRSIYFCRNFFSFTVSSRSFSTSVAWFIPWAASATRRTSPVHRVSDSPRHPPTSRPHPVPRQPRPERPRGCRFPVPSETAPVVRRRESPPPRRTYPVEHPPDAPGAAGRPDPRLPFPAVRSPAASSPGQGSE